MSYINDLTSNLQTLFIEILLIVIMVIVIIKLFAWLFNHWND